MRRLVSFLIRRIGTLKDSKIRNVAAQSHKVVWDWLGILHHESDGTVYYVGAFAQGFIDECTGACEISVSKCWRHREVLLHLPL
jgi:hypothetical protein